MKEREALRALSDALRVLEFLQDFEKDHREGLSEIAPTVNFNKFSSHAGYYTATVLMGETLIGKVPHLLEEAIRNQEAAVEERRVALRRIKP